MPGPWVDSSILAIDVATALQADDPSTLAPRWQTTISLANTAAAGDLTKFLTGMGYTIAQIDSWDDRVEANRRLGLLYALQRGNPLGKIDADMLKSLDPRQAIRDQGGINIGGIPTSPTAEASDVGGIASGSLCAFEHELHRHRHNWNHDGWCRQ